MQWAKYIVAFVVIILVVFFGLYGLESFSPEAFAVLAAGLLAFVFERFKWIEEDFNKLDPNAKQLVMWALLTVLVFGAFGLSCAGIITAFVCSVQGAFSAAVTLALAIAANQGVYQLSRKY